MENGENKNKWDFADTSSANICEDTRPTLTYWSDVWYRFKKNKLAILGLIMTVLIFVVAFIGPLLTDVSYSDQVLENANIPPIIEVTDLGDGDYAYIHKEFKIVNITEDGKILGTAPKIDSDMVRKTNTFDVNGKKVVIDYSKAAKKNRNKKDKNKDEIKYEIKVNGKKIDPTPIKKVWNKTNFFGTDTSGRDVLIRVLYGGRISLTVGVVAAIMNCFVGILYGGIAGYEGGRTDNIMMRFVDFLSSIPLLLIVILIGVFVQSSGLFTIVLTIGLVYWVDMARLVRGQVMTLKQQEFVLAARTLGASKARIISKHLIPNALGPIVVSMMMSVPSAIFTESFLSFIGLGVSAPQASWGTLASDALGVIRSFPYQLIIPSIAIAVTMFALNFVGDGLRDALDPKQRN